MDRIELELYLNNLLETARFKDYCPNGLQVEGRRRVEKLATGVTASLAFLEAALEWGADAVLVHHGYFWRSETPQITGRKYRRLRTLLANDLNLFAYHLPLDSHPQYGNNAQLGAKFEWIGDQRFGDQDLGWMTTLPMPITRVSTLGPSPISVAPLIGAPNLPSSMRYASVHENTNLPDTMSTCPPPNDLAKMPIFTRLSSSAGSSLPPFMKVFVIRGIGACANDSRRPLPVGSTPISRALSRSWI